MRIDEIYGYSSALHSFDLTPFTADYAHFFQRSHDPADVGGCASDPFGELVTSKQNLPGVLPEIEYYQIKSMTDLIGSSI
jgi:hypothetical protein